MRLNTSTISALHAAMELARARAGRIVTVGEVASRYGLAEGSLAKVFQRLVRAGIARGTRGVGGGYRLARPASKVTILDVVRAFEPVRPGGWCPGDRGADHRDHQRCSLARVFDEMDQMLEATFASITLETLVAPALQPAARRGA